MIVFVVVLMTVTGFMTGAGLMTVPMIMPVGMAVRMPLGIGTGLGIEGRLMVLERRAQSGRQRFQHMVRRESHPPGLTITADRQLHVAIAKVVAEPRQLQAGGNASRHDRLVGRQDFDDLAALGTQQRAVTQYRPAVEKQANLTTAIAGRLQPPSTAQFEWQRHAVTGHGVGRRLQTLSEFQHRPFLGK